MPSAHNDKFLGGAESPHFIKRISDLLRHWKRVTKLFKSQLAQCKIFHLGTRASGKLAVTTFIWKLKACQLRMFIETPGKVYADKGKKRIPVRTSGQEKNHITAFLVQNMFGKKLPLYPIRRDDTTANRPAFHIKKQNSSN